MKQSVVDTPRTNSWANQVNQPGFVPSRRPSSSVRLCTVKNDDVTHFCAPVSC